MSRSLCVCVRFDRPGRQTPGCTQRQQYMSVLLSATQTYPIRTANRGGIVDNHIEDRSGKDGVSKVMTGSPVYSVTDTWVLET